MLTLKFKQDCNMEIMYLDGDFDLNAEEALNKAIADKDASRYAGLIWNFQNVRSISSSGIAILFNAYMEVKKKGIITKLTNVDDTVLDILSVHKILPAFDIHPTEDAALKQVRLDLAAIKSSNSKRLFERIPIDLSASFKLFRKGRESATCKSHDATATSLSKCGLFLKTHTSYPTGTPLEINISLHDARPEPKVAFVAKVAWVAGKECHPEFFPGIALSILTITTGEKLKLMSYLDAHGG